jgi:hypothetical protein
LRASSKAAPFPRPFGEDFAAGIEEVVREAMGAAAFEQISGQGYDMAEEEAVTIALALRTVSAVGQP